MSHGIFSRPGVVDAIDTYGRPVEIHDRNSAAVTNHVTKTGVTPEPGAVVTDEEAEDWWRNHVDEVPVRPLQPTFNAWPAVGVAAMTLGGVIVGAIGALIWQAMNP